MLQLPDLCPELSGHAEAPELKAGGKTVKPMVAIALVLALFFLPIFVTQSLGNLPDERRRRSRPDRPSESQ
ncbi:MAG: hypothetical protein MZV70_36045 [Desulfobacterales bacterium]|nr:hypothetical protein [Desulfobacterales bacterium]